MKCLKGLKILLFTIFISVLPNTLFADIDGSPPVKIYSENKLRGSYAAIGSTLTLADQYEYGMYNFYLLSETSASFTQEFPSDAKIKKAFLFWSASTYDYPAIADNSAYIKTPDGKRFDVSTNQCILMPLSLGNFYYCRADITSQLKGLSIKKWDSYTVGGVDALISSNCNIDPLCQARYAGWALIVVWESQTYNRYRDIVIYDGFYHLDETTSSAGIAPPFTLDGFVVGSPAYAEFTFFGLEGDPQLGEPEQSLLPKSDPLYCVTCNDFIRVKRPGGNYIYLQNDSNPPNNIWNSSHSTVEANGVGIDIDTFNIGEGGLNVLRPGDTQLIVQAGVGDGFPVHPISGDPNAPDFNDSAAGGGESVFLGFIALGLDTVAPIFESSQKHVDKLEASAGETLTYTIDVINTGSADATNVVITDSLPANTTYVPNSTYLDGSIVPDVNGNSPLFTGMKIGTVKVGVNNRRRITFSVRINDNVAGGTTIYNKATISCSEVSPFNTNQVATLVKVASLSEFSKKVLSITDPYGRQKSYLEPGDSINYEIRIKSNSSFPITIDRFEDPIPRHTRLVGITQQPPGSVDESTPSTIVIRKISLEAYGVAYIRFTLRVDTVGEWGSSDPINGYQIKNQATLSGGSLDKLYVSDDPTTPQTQDPTTLTVRYGSDLSSSSKSVTDLNGGNPEPGDELLYTIIVRNTGTRGVSVQVEDTLSAYADFLSVESVNPSTIKYSYTPGKLVFYNFSLATNETATIKYRVRISYSVPSGTYEFKNTARIYSLDEPNYFVDVSSSLTVVSGPKITLFQKGAKINGVESRVAKPGDRIDYYITIKNTGNGIANNVVIEDAIDSNLTLDISSISDGGKYSNGRIVWEYLTIGVGITRTLTFSARVNIPIENNKVIKNQASLYSQDITKIFSDDPQTSILGDSTDITVKFTPSIKNAFKFVNGAKSIFAHGGDVVTFTIEFENDSPGPLTNVVVSDSVSNLLKNVQPVTAGGVVDANQTINWSISRLNYQEKKTFIFTAEVKPPVKPSTTITNFATVIASSSYTKQTDTVTIYVYDEPNLTNTFKYASYNGDYALRTHNANAGDTLVFSIKVKNSGPVKATGVRIRDPLDSRIVNVSDISDGGYLMGNEIIWDIPQLMPNEERTVSFKGQIKSPLPNKTQISNQARVTSNETKEVLSDDPDTPISADPLIITISSAPFMVLNKKAVDESGQEITSRVRAGSTFSFVIEVINTGNAIANDVVITDYIDKERYEVLSIDKNGYVSGNFVVWNIPQIEPSESNKQTVSFKVKVLECVTGTMNNYAELTAREVTTPKRSNTVVLSVDNLAKKGRFYKRLLTPREVSPSEKVVYELTYDTDDISLCDVKITDIFDQNLRLISASSGSINGNTLTLNLKDLKRLEPIRVEASVNKPVENGSVIRNQAYIEASNYNGRLLSDDPDTPQIDDPTEIRIKSAPDIYLVKTADVSEVPSGGTINYSILVINTGTDYAKDLVITDSFDEMYQYISEVGLKGEGEYNENTHTVKFTVPTLGLAPQYYKKFDFSIRLKGDIKDGTILNNQSRASGSNVSEVLSDNNLDRTDGRNKTSVLVVNRPEITVVKLPYRKNNTLIPKDEYVYPEEEYQYKIRLKNSSSIDAYNISIRDAIDTSNLTVVEVGNNGIFDGKEVRFDYNTTPQLKQLKSGEETELYYRVVLKVDAQKDSRISNQAIVSCSNSSITYLSDDTRTPQKNDATVVVVNRYAGPYFKSSSKEYSVASKPIKSGDRIDFVIKVINSGDTASSETKLVDELEKYGWEYVKGSTKLNGVSLQDINGRSPLESGLMVKSAKYKNGNDGVVDTISNGGVEESGAIVEFSAIVPKNVALMKNGARITYKGGEYEIPEIQIPIGDKPLITTLVKDYSLSSDKNGNSIADIGDTIRFYLKFKNEGYSEAKQVEIKDAIPTQASYLAGTMTLSINGVSKRLTDEVDSDEGELVRTESQLYNRFVIRNLPAQSEVLITFDAVVNICGGFLNQAELVYDNGSLLSDYDGNPANGIQKTFVATCELPQTYFELYKSAVDNNGGKVEPSDTLSFKISITSQGNSTEEEVTLMDDIPQYVSLSSNKTDVIIPPDAVFSYVPPPAGRFNNGLIIIKGLKFGRDRPQSTDIIFKAAVKKEARYGDVIENKAYLYTRDNRYFESNTVRLAVGGEVGSVSVQGILFRKMNRNKELFNYDSDILLSGYRIVATQMGSTRQTLRAGPPKFKPAENIITDENGKFVIMNLQSGKYLLEAYNEKGYVVGKKEVDLSEGSLSNVEFGIIPIGVVYSSEDLRPLEDVVVLLKSQSGREQRFITGRDGLYWFELEKDSYKIDAYTNTGLYIFPSAVNPPDNNAKIDKEGYVSDDFFPREFKSKKYVTEVDLRAFEGERPALINNNLPLDPAKDLITFYKTANKSIVKKGELIEYSLYIKNGTSREIELYLTDEPDRGITIKSRDFGLYDLGENKTQSVKNLKVDVRRINSKMLFTTETFRVPSGGTRVIKYLAYVSFDSKLFKFMNRATIINSSGSVIKEAYNSIFVERDYDFENSMIFGRVFCDENNNGKFDAGEQAINSAKIVLDSGYIATSDTYGRYHFPILSSGYHIVKIDKASLPAGMTPQSESVDMYFTDGLPAKINFSLECNFEKRVLNDSEFYKAVSDYVPMPKSDKTVMQSATNQDQEKNEVVQKGVDKPDGVRSVSGDNPQAPKVAEKRVEENPDSRNQAKISSEGKSNFVVLPAVKITQSDRVLISGNIAPSNRIMYKGKEIKTENGRFRYEIPLNYGQNKIVLDILTPDGRISSIFYEVERKERDPFILAYVSGWLSNSDFYPDGYLPSTHINAGPLGLDGKALFYGKHHIDDKFGFKDIDITVHFDTSKMREREFNLLENRLADYMYFPTFSDSSTVIKDVNSIDKLYIRLDADRNRLLFGNYNSQINGIEQFRYEKNLYGLSITLDNKFEKYHTSNYTKIFAGIPLDYSRHKRTVLKATGGSVYFLGVSDIINGSENIRVVVKDSLTGDIISDRTLVRYTDYTMNYTTGTLILNQPLNSYIETPSTFGIATNPSGSVYIIAEYDYFSLNNNDDYSIGGFVKENFDERLDISAGFINEIESSDSKYRLYSLGLSMRYLKYSSVKFEFAGSEYAYSDYLLTMDGGISGRSLSVENKDGYSILFEDRGDIADLLLKEDKILSYRLFFKMNTPYFASASTMLNQGIKSAGLEVSKEIDKRLSLSTNFYAHFIEPLSLTTFDKVGDIDLYQTQQRLGYRLNDNVELMFENLYYYADIDTDRLRDSYSTDIAGVGSNYKITQRLNIFGSLHSVFWGSEDEFRDITDRLYVTLGTTYKLKPKLYLTLSDTLRLNLDNYTQISARTPISETGSIYFGERLSSYDNEFVATSIVGSEEQIAKGISSYGEYQIDTLSNQLNSRAILGTKGRFAIMDGLNAMLNYEHTEVVSNGEISYNYTEPNAIVDPNLSIIQNYQQSQTRKGPLYGYSYTQKLSINNTLIYDYMGLNYPMGFAEGDNRRDVVSGSLEYTRLKNIKTSIFGEFRYDNNDENFNGEDRMQYLVRLSCMWGISRDISLTLFSNFLNVQNLKYDRSEYSYSENGFGLALRPVDFDWVNLFLKFSNFYEKRYDLITGGEFSDYSHIFSLIPVFELPYGFELVEKLALKRSYLNDSALHLSDSLDTLLWINRVNYNFYKRLFSIGLEYRILTILSNEFRSGFLIDIGYNFNKYFKLAVGYNFTDFSDNLYRLNDHSYNGFFLRATGKY